MQINRRSFLKKLSTGLAVALVAPKVVLGSFNSDVPKAKYIKKSLKHEYNLRLYAKERLSEWWAEAYDRALLEALTNE